MTRTARQNAEDLNHDSESVKRILLGLTEREFWHVWVKRDEKTQKPVLDTHGNEIRMDVYRPEVTVPNGETCQIYLKIRVSQSGKVVVSVESFHLPRK